MTVDEVNFQLQRLRGLRGYPRQADSELRRIIEEHGRNLAHCHAVITSIIDEETECPRPATLRGFLQRANQPEDERWKSHRVCPLGLCVGDGWRVHHFLHTRGGSGTTREPITAEQAENLRGKIDAKVQTIYEGVAPCACRGAGAAA